MSKTIDVPANAPVKGVTGEVPFGTFVRQVLLLDACVEGVALEEAGREPRWVWRGGSSPDAVHLADPFLFTIAEGFDGLRLQFVVLAYSEIIHIMARVGSQAYVTVAISPGHNAYALGTRLMELIDRWEKRASRPPVL